MDFQVAGTRRIRFKTRFVEARKISIPSEVVERRAYRASFALEFQRRNGTYRDLRRKPGTELLDKRGPNANDKVYFERPRRDPHPSLGRFPRYLLVSGPTLQTRKDGNRTVRPGGFFFHVYRASSSNSSRRITRKFVASLSSIIFPIIKYTNEGKRYKVSSIR